MLGAAVGGWCAGDIRLDWSAYFLGFLVVTGIALILFGCMGGKMLVSSAVNGASVSFFSLPILILASALASAIRRNLAP